MRNWFADQRGAWFFLLLGLGLIGVFVALELRFPQAGQLETARGRVMWQQDTRGALYFILSDHQQFVLNAKGDQDGRQRAAIRDGVSYPITVTFFRQQKSSPGVVPGDFYTAYGVVVGGKEVASLEEVHSAYRRDDLVALAMGVLAAVAGAWRLRTLRVSRVAGGRPASRRPR